MKIDSKIIAVVLVAVIIIAGVVYYVTLPPVEEEPPEDLAKIAMVLPGSITDQGWSQAFYDNVVKLGDEKDVEVAFSESIFAVDAGGVFTDYAQEGFDIILGADFGYIDGVIAIADSFPDTLFLLPEGGLWDVDRKVNVIGYGESEAHFSAYLVGVLATGVSKTGIVGEYQSFEMSYSIALMEAFKQGALEHATEAGIPIKVLEATLGTYEDAQIGLETTNALIDAGADVVFGTGDGVNVGGIQAVAGRTEDVLFIGASGDQRPINPEIVIASVSMEIYEDVLAPAVDMLVDGTLFDFAAAAANEGYFEVFGYRTTMEIDIDDWTPDVISADLQTKLETLQQEIDDGTLDIPYTIIPTGPVDYTPP